MTDLMGFLLLHYGITISSLLQHFCVGSVRKDSVAYAGSDFSSYYTNTSWLLKLSLE